MANSFTTIFFDWGGVVADDPGDEFLDALLKNLGATDGQVERISRNYMGQFMRGKLTETEYWRALRDNYDLVIDDSISEEFTKWSGLVANDQILNLVNEARSKGIKTAILSNVIEPTYAVLDQAGFYGYFDEVVASCRVGYAKPEAAIYELALKQLEARVEQSIFIDDKQRNLDPADKMGFTTVLAQSPEQIIRDVRGLIG